MALCAIQVSAQTLDISATSLSRSNGDTTSASSSNTTSNVSTASPTSVTSPALSTNGTVSARLSAATFIAGLFWSSKTTGMHRRCAATIISETILVTSGACAQSQNPSKKYGSGEWRIVAGTDNRFLDTTTVTGNAVKTIDINKCQNFATIVLSEPLTLSDTVKGILLSSSPVSQTTTMATYNTTNTQGDPLLTLSQGGDDACELLLPGYTKRDFLCTQPVDKQKVTADFLGGDPIIGFVVQSGAAQPVLFGVTGLYYSTIAEAQAAQTNDPTAYRYNALVLPHIGNIATLGGLDAQKIATAATPM
ncbi:hypothetical protein GGI05_000340 [Coemansia sp. RSA 2603]|nr:hypothetical protein GGI05_000340 [Coemansia sp. RSA 2603]